MSNTPDIRFKGFTEPWEQRKLSKVLDVLDGDRGKNYPTEVDFSEKGHTLFLNASNVTANGFAFTDNQYISEVKSNSMGNGKIQKDDIILTSRGSLGHVAWYNDDISNKIPFARINSGMLILRKKSNVNTSYVYQFLKSDKGQDQISFMSFGSAQPQLTKKGVENLDIILPNSLEEQEQLACFFSSIDHLITLHQHQCDEMSELKKFMLQKMFPKNGEQFPEIRFGGFTQSWEQRKLGEVAKRVTRKNENMESTLPLTISAQYGLVDQYTFFNNRVASKDVSGYYLIKKGEFAYNKSYSDGYPWGAIKRLDRYEMGVLSTLYIVFEINNAKVDSQYLATFYDTNLWHKDVSDRAAEGARNHGLLNIAPNDFFDTEVKMPQSIEEQNKIGEYFKQLDNLITLHQRKCDELKEFKKFMLQNMFPKKG